MKRHTDGQRTTPATDGGEARAANGTGEVRFRRQVMRMRAAQMVALGAMADQEEAAE